MLFVIATALLISASASYAVFPVPDGTQTFKVSQGWYGPGVPVWYICTDSSNIRYATTLGLRLTPKLNRGFYGAGVAAMFVVTNGTANQGPVFETIPGQALYSGIWRVREVTWVNLNARVPLTSIGQILALQASGDLTYSETETRLDCPILMVGRLGIPANSAVCLSYVIPQATNYSTTLKTITLPFYYAYCSDQATTKISTPRVIIPDASDPTLAFQLKANYAPALNGWGNSPYQLAGTQRFWVFTGAQPVNQYPVIEFCPSTIRSTSSLYSPVGWFTVLRRNIAPWTVIKTPKVIDCYLTTGGLILISESQFVNAPAI